MYQVTQHNGDTGETFTATGSTVAEALAEVVSIGQASTQYLVEDVAWLGILAESLSFAGEADRGFARYQVVAL